MTSTQKMIYLTACAYCGVAVSNVRVPDGPDAINARAVCPDCYEERNSVRRDDDETSGSDNAFDARRYSVPV